MSEISKLSTPQLMHDTYATGLDRKAA